MEKRGDLQAIPIGMGQIPEIPAGIFEYGNSEEAIRFGRAVNARIAEGMKEGSGVGEDFRKELKIFHKIFENFLKAKEKNEAVDYMILLRKVEASLNKMNDLDPQSSFGCDLQELGTVLLDKLKAVKEG